MREYEGNFKKNKTKYNFRLRLDWLLTDADLLTVHDLVFSFRQVYFEIKGE